MNISYQKFQTRVFTSNMSRGWNDASVDKRNERSSRWLEFGSQHLCQASCSCLLLFGPPPVPGHMHTDVHKERQAYKKVKIKQQGFSLKNKASRWGCLTQWKAPWFYFESSTCFCSKQYLLSLIERWPHIRWYVSCSWNYTLRKQWSKCSSNWLGLGVVYKLSSLCGITRKSLHNFATTQCPHL